MFGNADGPHRRQQLGQQALASGQLEAPQVVRAEQEQVERIQGGRPLYGGATDIHRAREPAALLEPRKTRQAFRVVHDHLAVEQEVVVG